MHEPLRPTKCLIICFQVKRLVGVCYYTLPILTIFLSYYSANWNRGTKELYSTLPQYNKNTLVWHPLVRSNKARSSFGKSPILRGPIKPEKYKESTVYMNRNHRKYTSL